MWIARLKMLTLQKCHHINKIEGKLKYIQTLNVTQKKESSIVKDVQEQQRKIWPQVCTCTEVLDKPIMIHNSDNKVAPKWVIQNPVIVHSFLTIFGPFSILVMARNQVSSPSVGPNHVNIGKTSGEENTVAIAEGTSGGGNANAVKFDIKNERAGGPKRGVNSIVRDKRVEGLNRDTKVGLDI